MKLCLTVKEKASSCKTTLYWIQDSKKSPTGILSSYPNGMKIQRLRKLPTLIIMLTSILL